MHIKTIPDRKEPGAHDLLAQAAQAAEFLRSLAHEHRLAILCLLEGGPRSVGAIAAGLGLSQPKVSQHLMRLRAQRMVSATRSGTTLHYRATSQTALRIAAALKAEFCPPEDAPNRRRKL
jgi:ArsR family transcriptional regulator